MAILSVLQRINKATNDRWVDLKYNPPRPVVPHGFRAPFRTWAEETTGFPHAIVEQAMGHRVAAEVERSYIRTDMLDKRRQLMNPWGSYIEPKTAGNIVPLARPA